MTADETAGAISGKKTGLLQQGSSQCLSAASAYREGHPPEKRLDDRVLDYKAFERLEPCAGKLASTVLRGLRHEVAFESVMTGR